MSALQKIIYAGRKDSALKRRMSTLSLLLLLMLLVFFSGCSTVSSDDCARLSEELPSPDGQWRLFWLFSSHQLILHDTKTHDEKIIYESERDVDALWSPDSRFIILNDWAGSNVSTCVLLYPGQNKEPFDLSGAVDEALDKGPWEHIVSKNSDKWYLSGVRWLDNRRIELKLHGWTYYEVAPHVRSFVFSMIYTINEGVSDVQLQGEHHSSL